MKSNPTGITVTGIRANLPTILFLVFVLFFLFTARIIYSPLLLSIEESLGLGHAEAATFFLFITIGYSVMMIFSGFVAAGKGCTSWQAYWSFWPPSFSRLSSM